MAESIDLETFFTEIKKEPGFSAEAFQNLLSDTNPETTLKILARFTQTLTVALDSITQQLVSGNVEVIWKACHKVAGSAELLGFQGFGQKSKSMSEVIRASTEVSTNRNDVQKYIEEGTGLLTKIKSAFPNLTNYL